MVGGGVPRLTGVASLLLPPPLEIARAMFFKLAWIVLDRMGSMKEECLGMKTAKSKAATSACHINERAMLVRSQGPVCKDGNEPENKGKDWVIFAPAV